MIDRNYDIVLREVGGFIFGDVGYSSVVCPSVYGMRIIFNSVTENNYFNEKDIRKIAPAGVKVISCRI